MCDGTFQKVVDPVVAMAVGSRLRYEINQLRFVEGDDENTNRENLQAASNTMIQSILHSSEHIPRYDSLLGTYLALTFF